MFNDVVGEHYGERFVADGVARRQHGVAEAEGLLLDDERDGGQVGAGTGFVQEIGVAGQPLLQVGSGSEIVGNAFLARRDDDDDLADAGLGCLSDHILEHGPVEDGQQLFGYGAGNGQKAGA